jgi:regulator of RNase E activity RraA
VLVVDGGGALDRAVLGEIMARYAAARGLAALVVDGAVRDVEGLAGGALPVFARGVNHLGPYKDGPGEIGGPVHAGGTVVRAGDVVVGDADGVVVIPRAYAAKIADEAVHHDELEVYLYERISNGESLRGIYPPNEQTLRDYEIWKQRR